MTELLYFEDIRAGETFVGETVVVERDRMLAFAAEFDDQPMHLDAAAARAMGLDDIIAPGAYIFALTGKALLAIWKRLHFLPSGLGIEVSFVRPVYAGDTLTAHVEVTAIRPSSKPGRGWLETKTSYLDQNGETAAKTAGTWLLKSRPG